MKTTYARYDVLFNAINTLHFKDELLVRLDNIAPRLSNKVELGINWWACGTVDTTKARDFAKQLENCAKIADMINSLDLEYENKADAAINDSETYEQACEAMADWIRTGNLFLIKAFFVGMEG